jgi:hypothetical protein
LADKKRITTIKIIKDWRTKAQPTKANASLPV